MRTILIIIGILSLCLICLVGLVGLSYFFDIPAGLWGEAGYFDQDGYLTDETYYDDGYYYDEYNQGQGYDQEYDYYEEGFPDLPPGITNLAPGRYTETSCPFQTISDRVTCGYLAVPEEHTNTASPTLYLAVATIHASSANPSGVPLVYLEGGPGGSALDGAEILWLDSRLTEDRDVILLDQRGTGYSVPTLNCHEYDRIPTLRQNDDELIEDCRNRLEDEGIDMTSVQQRPECRRHASAPLSPRLPEIDLLGVSYGTRLALTVMRDYPEGIRSMILDSVYPPQRSTPSTKNR